MFLYTTTMKHILIICSLFVGVLTLTAQSDYPVQLLTDARDGEIRLRWAPTDFTTWDVANQRGYRLERMSADGNVKVLATALRPLL